MAVIATLYAGLRLEGVLSTRVERDGDDSTAALIELVRGSRIARHAQAILLQGIALGGFNVIDVHGLHVALEVPVLVVVRRSPDLAAIERALRTRVPGGERKWSLIQQAGPMEPIGGVYVQRAGIDVPATAELLGRLAVHGKIPEPLRAAHLIAGGLATGESRGRT